MAAYTLVANPGSASRKYGLYDGDRSILTVHFEQIGSGIAYSYVKDGQVEKIQTNLSSLNECSGQLLSLLKELGLVEKEADITSIAVRVVAPSTYFQHDRVMNAGALKKLAELEQRAPLHIHTSLYEITTLKKHFPKATIVGVSDSAFHARRPEVARRYAISPKDADRLDLYRFGYHGLSIESTLAALKHNGYSPHRLLVCHLGSGDSVTAVRNGKSVDTTMGYSPLEGLMMATRAGNIDPTAVSVLQKGLSLSEQQLQTYLNQSSGLAGVSGVSPDLRQLLRLESLDDGRAELAIGLYIYRIQQAIGQMAAVLGGVDTLVFTGTVGERNPQIRRRILAKLLFLGLEADPRRNHGITDPSDLVDISPLRYPASVLVVPANEAAVMARHAQKLSQ